MKIIKSPGCTHIQTDKAGVFVVSCRECYEKAIKAARLDEAREWEKIAYRTASKLFPHGDYKTRCLLLKGDLHHELIERFPELRDSEKGGTE